MKAELVRFDELATEAVKRYKALRAFGSPMWETAAIVRIGDVRSCQATRLLTLPHQPQVASRQQWRLQLEKLVEPLHQQAERQWKRVIEYAEDHDAAARWGATAKDRLTTPPKCEP